MDVLIVESDPALGALWARHLQRHGMGVWLETTQSGAARALGVRRFDIIILDIVLDKGSALAISDLAGYRHPDTRVIFVTDSAFFSDGSIFAVSQNACAFLQSDTPPEDLTAMVEHYGRPS